MRFDTKIAVAVREDLAVWQKLNVTAFLSSGVAGAHREVVGEPYEDASGRTYLPMFREPVMVFTADSPALARTLDRARSRDLATALYTDGLFKTGNDDDNRAAVRAVPTEGLDLVGVAVYGPRRAVDKVVKGLRLHP
ncbi:DUF2000 domain-containing protein [Nocardiopsis sp. EMB25]|uniref:DUF2000 domain-containing protein n=1 Tax=Nocardiopsis TaxID=2013 RepID=UPI00034AF8F5|nr:MULTISPECIES: DUF2000 domain-containing protein [Nocardiopsis]MCY9783204.1 DUF2000 domain-containing protein [Nocardiopsis sp. EMB25]